MGAIAQSVDALTRRVALPLIAIGAAFVLLASFACGQFFESRIAARTADRAAAIADALAAAPGARLPAFDSTVLVARLNDTGTRVLDASAPELLREGSPAITSGRNGIDGRYWYERGQREGAGGDIVHYWMRFDLAAELRDSAVQQLVVTLGGILFVAGAVALVRRRLHQDLTVRLAALAAAVDGQAVARPESARDAFDWLIEASLQLNGTLGESRRRESASAARVQRLESEVHSSFHQLPVPLLKVSAEGHVTALNGAAMKLVGDELALPAPLASLFDAASPQLLFTSGEAVLRGRGGEIPVFLRALPAKVKAVPGEEGREWVIVLEDQRDRARLEAALRSSEERYRRMFEACNEGIWVLDTNLCTVSANARLGAMLGHDPAALTGRPVIQFLAEDREMVVAELHAALAGNAVPPRVVALCGGDDLRVWAMLSATALPGPERGALVLMLADITSTKYTEQALRESEQRLTLAAANGNITMWEYDCASGALVVDPRFAMALNRASPQIHDLASLLASCHPDDVAGVRQALAEHLAGRTPRYEAEFRLADDNGEWRWLHAQGQAERDADGCARRVLGVQRDVTTEKQALAALAQARDEAVRATQAKSRFLASMSHELRTPLNGVLGMLSLLEREHLSTDQREFVEIAVKSGRTLFELIDDVLDFSKIEAGALVLTRTTCDLRRLAEDAIDMLAERALQRGIDLVLCWDERVPRQVETDPARLRQILLNLLGNGVKFTEQGHVALHVCPSSESGIIRFSISDTGIGIAPDRQQAIFEPFEQADDSTSRRFGGTGLGLSITRQLVELMGGRLALDSAPQTGSTFSFELPLAVVPGTHGDAPALALAGRRLLLQEPSAIVADAAAALLRAHGATVEIVQDVREVRPMLAANAPAPDALLLAAHGDLERFGQDIASLRGIPGASLVPIVGLLPFGRRAGAADLRAVGAQAVITKPLRESHVLRVMSELLAPDALESLAATTPRLRASGAESAGGLAALKVLVVDDVTTNLKVAAGMLARLGIQATLAESGRAALDAVSTTAFDVVFMDCQMPGMDGFETTALIRARHLPGEGPHIIAMTANAASTDRDRCLAHGMDDYLAKPVLLSDLERMLHRWSNSSVAPPASPVPRAPAPVADTVVDRRTLDELSTLLGAEEFDALRNRFRRDARALLDRLAAALSGADLDAAWRAAHALKGAAANLGANRLAALCRAAETQDADALRAALGSLEAALEEFCVHLNEEAVSA